MTKYFDDAEMSLSYLSGEDWETMGAWERRLVFDCTVAVEMLGCPPDIRDRVHDIILRWGVQCLPPNAPSADFETPADYVQRMTYLASNLHNAFHTLARAGLDGFTDDPRAPFYRLHAQGQERREARILTKAWSCSV